MGGTVNECYAAPCIEDVAACNRIALVLLDVPSQCQVGDRSSVSYDVCQVSGSPGLVPGEIGVWPGHLIGSLGGSESRHVGVYTQPWFEAGGYTGPHSLEICCCVEDSKGRLVCHYVMRRRQVSAYPG